MEHENPFWLPNRLKYTKPYHQWVQSIDHVSMMVSNASVLLLESILRDNGIDSGIRRESGFLSDLCVTVAYSKGLISGYPFEYGEVDNGTMIMPLKEHDIISFPVSKLSYGEVHAQNGDIMKGLVVNVDTFRSIHEFYIRVRNAEWSQGEYIPFIKLHADEDNLNRLKQFDFSRVPQMLSVDRVRYMRFGELINP